MSDRPAGILGPPGVTTGTGWSAGSLRDFATLLLVAIIVTLVGGQILQAW
ncbi:hypothetical protein ACRAWG_12500 [Methylobacterium sp. P31]